MTNVFIILGILGLLLSMVSAFLIIKLPKRFWIKFISIPLILIIGLMFAQNIQQVWGFPFPGLPQGKFQLQSYRVLYQTGDVMRIEAWVIQKRKSRLYVFPYSREVDQKFAQAMREQGSGNGTREFDFKVKSLGKKGEQLEKETRSGNGLQPTQSVLQSEHKETQESIPPKQQQDDETGIP